MRIENINSKYQFYTNIIPYGKSFINYTICDRSVIFSYKSRTYKIKCNPFLVEDNIVDYIKTKEL